MAESPTARLNILQGLEDLTECSIHCGTYENPRQLPCLHSFCLQCLANYTKDKPLTSNITCPLCRKEITVPDDGIEGFPRNFFIDKIIEIKRLTGPLQKDTLCDICQEDEDLTSDVVVPVASTYCAECRKNHCDRCTKEHRRHNKSHTVLKMGSEEINEELVKKLEVSFCSNHSGKAVEMFCFDCQSVICMICFAEKHNLHKCSDINNSANDFRKQMEFEINAISVCLSEGQKSKEMIAKKKDDFLQEIQSVEERILDRTVELKRIIDRDRNLLLDELKIIKSSHLKEMQIKDEEIQEHLTTIASLKTYGKEIIAVGSASDICRSVNQFSVRTKEVQATVEEATFCEVFYRSVSFQSTGFQESVDRNILGKLEVNCEKLLLKDLSDSEKFLQKTLNVHPGKKDSSIDLVFATGSKSEYDNASQENQSPCASSYPLQQPAKQWKLARSISMHADVYEYIQRFLHMELDDIKAFCDSVQELRDEASNVKLRYTVKYGVEGETVKRRFQMLLNQVKVEEYNVPARINASVLESVVRVSAESESTMIFVQGETNSLKIVGRPDRVDKLKKSIAKTVLEQLRQQQQQQRQLLSTGTNYSSEQSCKQQ